MTVHYQVSLANEDKDFFCEEGDTLLRAGLRQGLGLAYECNVGACGSCKFDLVEGEVADLFPEAPGLRPKEREKGKRLACQCVPLSNCTIKIRGGPEYVSTFRPVRLDARCSSRLTVTPDMAIFSMSMLKKIIGLFSPARVATVAVIGQGVKFGVVRGKTILEAALQNGIDFPHECKVGTCGKCKYKLVNGRISELSSSAMALSGELYQSGHRLACQSIPKCDLDIEVETSLGRTAGFQECAAVILSQLQLAHDVMELTLVPEEPIAFQSGQYASIINQELGLERSYSFSDPQEEGGKLRFHIRHVPGGRFSSWLFAGDRTGSQLRVRGPYGQFHYHESDNAIVCVAGGTGLAPIKCILESMTVPQRQRDVFLFFGARQQRDLYCLEKIEALRSVWGGRFEFIPVLSEESADSDWAGRRGLVTEYLCEFLAGHSCEAYLCGPPPMVDAVEVELIKTGIPASSIYADRFYSQANGTQK